MALSAVEVSSRSAPSIFSNGRGDPQAAGRREMVQFLSEVFLTSKSLMISPLGLAGFLIRLAKAVIGLQLFGTSDKVIALCTLYKRSIIFSLCRVNISELTITALSKQITRAYALF